MKKIAAILFLSVYALSVLGIGVKQFYCCGKLKSTSLTLVQEAKEKCSNSAAMKGCCKTKFKTLKLKDSHVNTDAGSVAFTKHFSELDIPVTAFSFTVPVTETVVLANTSHAPPDRTVPVYIMNCVYRI
ncbi:HYC_CC_PP family protein [Ferruginibacter sp.]